MSAESLFRDGRFDGSVNRSYYAVFSAMRALLATKALDSKKHSGVISLFNRHFVKSGVLRKGTSSVIEQAKVSREKADYEDYVEISDEEAKHQLENARGFISEVEKTLSNILDDDR
jgi:uncharacterized protein (UPF0332 family)